MTLDQLAVGHSGIVTSVGGQGALRKRLLDMGLTPKVQVSVLAVSPKRNPIELTLRGYTLTLRREDAKSIEVQPS